MKRLVITLLLLTLIVACIPIPSTLVNNNQLPIVNTKAPETPGSTINSPTLVPSVEPTSQPISNSTNTPQLPSVPKINPTATPVGQIFRDDFTGSLQPGWTWENENKDNWVLTSDGKLQIKGESDYLLKNGQQNNLLWHDLPPTDYMVSTHLIANPIEDYQQAAMFLFEDPENYVAINRGFCSGCVGSGIYFEYKINNQLGTYKIATSKTDLYLRLVSKNKVISSYYAFQPDKWVLLGKLGDYFQFKKVGLGVSKTGAKSDLIGQYDWFEIDQAK